MSTTIRSGVWNTTAWPSRGRSAVMPTATSTVTTTAAATSRTSRTPGWRASATVGLGRDADRGHQDATGERPAHLRAQPGLRAMEGHGEVGADDRIRWVAGGEVDGGRGVDGEH